MSIKVQSRSHALIANLTKRVNYLESQADVSRQLLSTAAIEDQASNLNLNNQLQGSSAFALIVPWPATATFALFRASVGGLLVYNRLLTTTPIVSLVHGISSDAPTVTNARSGVILPNITGAGDCVVSDAVISGTILNNGSDAFIFVSFDSNAVPAEFAGGATLATTVNAFFEFYTGPSAGL